jgi:glycosyltransferase involved in cell wall biosynthesis
MDMSLTFSIVTPSLNQGKFIEQTICSVLAQAGDFFIDYIIIDGGSTDETLSIITKYDELIARKLLSVKCAGITLRWWSEPDRGQSHAINKGFNYATGDIFCWLNSDDTFASGAFQAVVAATKSNPSANVILGSGEMVDEEGNSVRYITPEKVTFKSLHGWIHNYFWQPSCFFSRHVWFECGPLADELHFAMDLDLWLKISKRFPFLTIDTKLSISLRHPQAKTTAFGYLSVMEAALVIASNGGSNSAMKDLRFYADYLEGIERGYKRRLAQMEKSTSWRITAPLRFFRKCVYKMLSINSEYEE